MNIVSSTINTSLDIILSKSNNKSEPLRYLEIGVHKGETFIQVNENIGNNQIIKVGVDPYGSFDDGRIYRMTSQVFFAMNEYFWKKTYDVIFLDGMHFSPILNQEIEQSLKILNPNGIIILDDTIPEFEESGQVEVNSFVEWSKLVSYPKFHNYRDDSEDNYKYVRNFPGFPHAKGDCWVSVIKVRMTRPDIKVGSFVNNERPITLLSKNNSQPPLPFVSDEKINWDFFKNNFNEIFCPINSVIEMFNN